MWRLQATGQLSWKASNLLRLQVELVLAASPCKACQLGAVCLRGVVVAAYLVVLGARFSWPQRELEVDVLP